MLAAVGRFTAGLGAGALCMNFLMQGEFKRADKEVNHKMQEIMVHLRERMRANKS